MWWEWESASESRRQLTWSTRARDLRKLAGLAKTKTNEEIAAEDMVTDDRVTLTRDAYRWPTARSAIHVAGWHHRYSIVARTNIRWETIDCSSCG